MAWYDDITNLFKGLSGFNTSGSNTTPSYTLRPGDSLSNLYKQMGIPDITQTQDPSSLTGMARINANYGSDMAEAAKIGKQVANQSNLGQYLGYGLAGLTGLEALSGLMNAFTGYKNYQLAKDQFGFAKDAYNRNIANQAQVINNTYDYAAQIAAGMIGGIDSAGNYGMVNQDIVDRYSENAKKKYVDGSRVG